MKKIEKSQKRKEKILNSGAYTKCEVIIPKIEQDFIETLKEGINVETFQPVVTVEKTKGVGTVETAILINALKQCIKVLSQENPLAVFLAQNMEMGAELYNADGKKTGEVKI